MSQMTQVCIEVTLDRPVQPPASVAAELAPATSEPRKALNALWRFFSAISGQLRTARVRTRIDAITEVQASLDLAVTQANIAVAEYFDIVIPGRGSFRITAVAAAADVTLGQFVSETNDNTTATNIRAAINGMIGLKDLVVATGATNHVIITSSFYLGAAGNNVKVIDGTVNGLTPAGGSLASGKNASSQVTSAVAITHANVTANDTFSIGGVTLTWKVAAGNEDEVTIGADATGDGDALAAAINVHTKLVGLVTAVNVTGTVTITHLVPARTALHFKLATSDATAMALTQPATTLTLALVQATREYDCGAP